jgi:putative SOS response-associated peptidase YedK
VEGNCPRKGREGDILARVCARYTLTSSPTQVAEHFELDAAETAALRPRYNVAPSQDVPVVTRVAESGLGARRICSVHWGLRGFGRPDAKAPTPINARIETAPTLPPFVDALRRGRCLVPADGFFEWRRRASGREPHWITLPERALFAFAGLTDLGSGGSSVAILTRPARGPLRELHDRMPVLLSPRDYAAWLDRDALGGDEALALCASPLSDELTFRPVDGRVNDVRFDDPACLAPSRQLAWF